MVLPRSDEGGSSAAVMTGQGSVVIFHCGHNTGKGLGVGLGRGRCWEAEAMTQSRGQSQKVRRVAERDRPSWRKGCDLSGCTRDKCKKGPE